MGLLDAIQNFGSKVRTASQPFLDVYNTPEFQQQITLGTSLLGGAGVPASIQAANKAGLLAQNTQDLKRQREAVGLLEQQFANNPRMLGLLQANPTGFIRAMTARELMPKTTTAFETLKARAIAAGFEPGSQEYKNFMASGGGTTGGTGITVIPFSESPTTEQVIEKTAIDGSALNLATAAGGDGLNLFQDVVNKVTGFVAGGNVFKERGKQKALVNKLNEQLLVPMVRELSPRGSMYAQKTIEKRLPQPSDSNDVFADKAEALIPDLVATAEILRTKLNQGGTPAEIAQTQKELQFTQEAIANYRVAIDEYKGTRSSTKLLNEADKIIGVD